MVQNFHLPPMGFGPGSQPEDDAVAYTQMPQNMRTYSAHVPEADDTAAPHAIALLKEIAGACRRVAMGGPAETFDVATLPAADRKLLAEVLGNGEVSVRMRGIPAIAAQESVFAGVWALQGAGVDQVEVAPVPTLAEQRAFEPVKAGGGLSTPRPDGLANAPAILVELLDKSAAFDPADPIHVINLTLLPHSEPDLVWLGDALGEGAVTILSRGYGNCRISASATRGVWRVQFFNSTDALILDTFEITAMPEVARAAPEDLADSGSRIDAVLEAIQ